MSVQEPASTQSPGYSAQYLTASDRDNLVLERVIRFLQRKKREVIDAPVEKEELMMKGLSFVETSELPE